MAAEQIQTFKYLRKSFLQLKKADVALTLSTLEEGLAYLETYSGDKQFEAPAVNFDGELSVLKIDIEGDRYHASIPGELARGIWEYQEALYKAAAFALYGVEDIRRLTASQRQDFELVFNVEEGSTDLFAKLKDFLAKLGEGFLTMESKHKAYVLVAVAVILTSGWGVTSVVESQSTARKEEIKSSTSIQLEEQKTKQFELLADLAAGNPIASKFAKASEEGARAIVRRAPDANNVKIGRANIDRTGIEEVNQRASKEKASAEIIQEDFWVFGAYSKDTSTTKYILARKDGADFTVLVNHDDFSPAELGKIWAAARDRKPIALEVNLTSIRGAVHSAQIVKVL